jgi:hypothetical protein
MKQALEALEHDNPSGRSATITALRQAIEQAEKRDWVGLTDEQIEAIHQSTWMQSTATLNDFARAIEAAHGIKEKNT